MILIGDSVLTPNVGSKSGAARAVLDGIFKIFIGADMIVGETIGWRSNGMIALYEERKDS